MSEHSGFDIVGIGCATVDELLYVDAYPAADAKTRVRRHERHCGGLTAVALIAAARFGARCAYAATLGLDDQSEFVAGALRDEGIDVSLASRIPDARPIHSRIIVDTANNTRNIFFTPGVHVGPAMELDAATIRRARVLFVDHYGAEATVRAAQIAREGDIPVVGDLERNDAPLFDEIFALTSQPILSSGFALRLSKEPTPELAAKNLLARGHDVVVVTHGDEGGIAALRGQPSPRTYPAFPVEVVDTTGCGDVFHGVYAAGLALGIDLDRRLRYASAAAAIKASRSGTKYGIPTRKEIETFLEARI